MGKTAQARLFEERRFLNLYQTDRFMDQRAGRKFTVTDEMFARQKQRVEVAQIDAILGIGDDGDDDFDEWLALQLLEE
jgi:hypothetical protein